MVSIGQVLKVARQHLNDTTAPFRWNDSYLIGALDECLAFLTSNYDYFTTQGFVEDVGNSAFNLEEKATKLLRVYGKDGQLIKFIHRDYLDRTKPGWRKETGPDIKNIVVDNSRPLWFWLYPRIVNPDDPQPDCEGIITAIEGGARITNVDEFTNVNHPFGSQLCELNIIFIKRFETYLGMVPDTGDNANVAPEDVLNIPLPMITSDLQNAIAYYISGTCYNKQQQAGSVGLAQSHLQLYTTKIDAIMARKSSSTSDASYTSPYNPMGVDYVV